MRYSELKCKDVINLRDCRKLGRIGDLEFDECAEGYAVSRYREIINSVIF